MTEQEARAEQGYTEVDPFDLSDDQSDEVTALAEATVERDALARAYDPDAFTDRALNQTRRAGAVIQWAVRRHLAVEAADRVIASGILAERSRVVEAAPSDTDPKGGNVVNAEVVLAALDDILEPMTSHRDTHLSIMRSRLQQLRERVAQVSAPAEPVQVEVTDEMVDAAIKAWWECQTEGPGAQGAAMRAALTAALGVPVSPESEGKK